MVDIEGVTYELESDPQDPYVVPGLAVAFCDLLVEEFVPVLFDPKGYGSLPYPPDFIAYRLVFDAKEQRLCAMYEVYWRRQDCTWKELNKDHDYDYEQIQVHFNLKTGKREKNHYILCWSRRILLDTALKSTLQPAIGRFYAVLLVGLASKFLLRLFLWRFFQ
jgi:hypothetical protein